MLLFWRTQSHALYVAVREQEGREALQRQQRRNWDSGQATSNYGTGADIILDPLGGEIFDAALCVLAWRGRPMVIGLRSAVGTSRRF